MMSPSIAIRTAVVVAAAGLAGCGMMSASGPTNLTARLSGAAEVPPVATEGSGALTGSFDKATSTLSWSVTYSGLSGPATAAHFHGAAPPGQNAGVLVPFSNVAVSPIQGSAKLTDAQVADVMAGRWYVNIHTRAHPGGEIRGQVAVQ